MSSNGAGTSDGTMSISSCRESRDIFFSEPISGAQSSHFNLVSQEDSGERSNAFLKVAAKMCLQRIRMDSRARLP